MRLLIDAAFPAATEKLGFAGVRLARWAGEETDEGLVEKSVNDGYDAVVLLGRHVLAQDTLFKAARRWRQCIVVVNADSPSRSAHDLQANLASIRRRVGPGRVLRVLASEVEDITESAIWPSIQ